MIFGTRGGNGAQGRANPVSVLFNEGTESHEFVLASTAENRKHAELMKKFPDMEHADPTTQSALQSLSKASSYGSSPRGASSNLLV